MVVHWEGALKVNVTRYACFDHGVKRLGFSKGEECWKDTGAFQVVEGVRGEGFCETRLLKLKITDGEITHMTLVILIALLK